MARPIREVGSTVGRPQGQFLGSAGWLIASLLLALVVWFLATATQNPTIQQRFPQRVPITVGVPEGYVITRRNVESAQITVRTLQSTWLQLDVADLAVNADFSAIQLDPSAEKMKVKVPLVASLLNNRPGAIIDFTPREIELELALRGEQLLQIKVAVAQEAPVGFIATSLVPSINEARLVGPKSAINTVASVQAPISLRGQNTSFSQVVELLPLDSNGVLVEDVQVIPPQITVSVVIQEREDVTGLLVVPSYAGAIPDGYQLKRDSWQPRRVFVRGDQRVIAAMNGTIPTEAIDLSGHIQPFTQTVQLKLPTGVTLPDPTDITITVVIEPILVTREFTGIAVQPQGLDPADYAISTKPDRVRVRVTGPQQIVAALTEKDISVYADLSGLSAGTHTVQLLASVSAAELRSENLELPENQAEITITSRNPTPTP